MTKLYAALREYTTGPVHWLKCDPEPFDAVTGKIKRFEIRLNDRDYQPGDLLVIERFDRYANFPEGCYSGEWALLRVLYVLPGFLGGQYGIQPGYVALSIDLLATGHQPSAYWPDASFDAYQASSLCKHPEGGNGLQD